MKIMNTVVYILKQLHVQCFFKDLQENFLHTLKLWRNIFHIVNQCLMPKIKGYKMWNVRCEMHQSHIGMGPSWPWSYDCWIYNYLCNQCLSPLMLWVRISIRARCTALCDKICQGFATGRWFSPGPPVSSTNKTDCHDITEILLKVALNTIKQINNHIEYACQTRTIMWGYINNWFVLPCFICYEWSHEQYTTEYHCHGWVYYMHNLLQN
jgi:hypothetical protein